VGAENTLKQLVKIESAILLELSPIEEAREQRGAEWYTVQ
jgi:hypothetical protein